MRTKRLTAAACAALIVCGAAGAQTVVMHGALDYTNYGLVQRFMNNDDDWDYTNGEAGLSGDAISQADLKVSAANFEFNLGIRLNASLGDEGKIDGIRKYTDAGDGWDGTPFYQGNMKVGFFNDQVNVYAGKWEDWSAGFIQDGYVLGAQNARYFASSDMGQYMTAIDIAPYFVSGLRIFAGLPILPGDGNGVNDDVQGNYWKNLYKKFQFAAEYKIPDSEMKFSAGFRPGTYYTGVADPPLPFNPRDTANGPGGSYLTSFLDDYFSEVFVQADLPDTLESIKLNGLIDFRWRKDNHAYINKNGEYSDETTFAIMAGVSADMDLVEDFPMKAEVRYYYANDDYIRPDEKLNMIVLGFGTEYKLGGSQWTAGIDVRGAYAHDARGTAFDAEDNHGVASTRDAHFDDVELGFNKMTTASVAGLEGDEGNYFSIYGFPFVRRDFSAGYVKLGIELQYSRFSANVTNDCFGYRVPVGLCFLF